LRAAALRILATFAWRNLAARILADLWAFIAAILFLAAMILALPEAEVLVDLLVMTFFLIIRFFAGALLT